LQQKSIVSIIIIIIIIITIIIIIRKAKTFHTGWAKARVTRKAGGTRVHPPSSPGHLAAPPAQPPRSCQTQMPPCTSCVIPMAQLSLFLQVRPSTQVQVGRDSLASRNFQMCILMMQSVLPVPLPASEGCEVMVIIT